MSRFLERIIEKEIDSANNHLPAKRVSLANVSQNENHVFETRGGRESSFRPKEIEWLTSEVPEKYHDSFFIPLVILRRTDFGPGIFSVSGSKPELFLINKIVGYVDLEWDKMGEWKPVHRYARPQVRIIRKKLPTTLGFTPPPRDGPV